MNVIFILLDSLNRPYLEPYGNKVVETKNMQRLAEKGITFENHFICSAACMPARRELFSGRKNEFLWRNWGSVEPYDRCLSTEAKRLGAMTALITDHYHYWEILANGYHETYDYTNLIRGHEFDAANSDPLPPYEELPKWVQSYLKWRPHQKKFVRYYRNVKDFKGEEDFHGPKVMQAACDWLDKNHSHEKFFLHIESFDPHEPFYVPEPYRSMYGSYNEDFTCWPPYQDNKTKQKFLEEASEEELEFIRNQYRGKVTMLDRWLGKVFDKLDQYDLWKNTMVILTTDHGHALAEPEKGMKQFAKTHPMFDDVTNIPLIIYHPDIEGNIRNTSTFSTIVDLRATILNVLGTKPKGKVMVDGKSLMPVLEGKQESIRDYVIHGMFGFGAGITTRDYTYIRGFDRKKELNNYTCGIPPIMSASVISGMGEIIGAKVPYKLADVFVGRIGKKVESGFYIPKVNIPQWKIPVPSIIFRFVMSSSLQRENFLFDRKTDLNFKNNLAGTEEAKKIEEEMITLMIKTMKEEGCPPEQFERLMLEEYLKK